jgi:hypothetical protein
MQSDGAQVLLVMGRDSKQLPKPRNHASFRKGDCSPVW